MKRSFSSSVIFFILSFSHTSIVLRFRFGVKSFLLLSTVKSVVHFSLLLPPVVPARSLSFESFPCFNYIVHFHHRNPNRGL